MVDARARDTYVSRPQLSQIRAWEARVSNSVVATQKNANREGNMKPRIHFGLVLSAVTLILFTAALSSATTPAAKPAAALPERNVIVILRDQVAGVPAARGAHAARSAAVGASQSSVIEHIRASGASRIHAFAM